MTNWPCQPVRIPNMFLNVEGSLNVKVIEDLAGVRPFHRCKFRLVGTALTPEARIARASLGARPR
jgi:hypothetical protein